MEGSGSRKTSIFKSPDEPASLPPEPFTEKFREAFAKNERLTRLEQLFATRLNQPLTVDRIAALLGMNLRGLEYQ